MALSCPVPPAGCFSLLSAAHSFSQQNRSSWFQNLQQNLFQLCLKELSEVRKSAHRNLEQRTWSCQRQRGCVMALFITGHMAIDFLLLTQDISVTPASVLPTLLFCQVYLYFSPALKANQVNCLLHEIKQNNWKNKESENIMFWLLSMGAVEQWDSYSCTKQGGAPHFLWCAGLNNKAGLYLCYCSNAHSYPKFHITFH